MSFSHAAHIPLTYSSETVHKYGRMAVMYIAELYKDTSTQ